jgi:uncharacterized protein YegP (UPF0339 family)
MKFQIYKAKDGYRWRAVAQNKKILADSGEAYSTKGNAKTALKRFRQQVPDATTVDVVDAEAAERSILHARRSFVS